MLTKINPLVYSRLRRDGSWHPFVLPSGEFESSAGPVIYHDTPPTPLRREQTQFPFWADAVAFFPYFPLISTRNLSRAQPRPCQSRAPVALPAASAAAPSIN
ncbi:hypothetical protein GWI33_014919 [Rhynchophorus ferrugineus]|uniref:Uncharacterized protein n=1 Tax=Rhynchophorus ferrugineus TaxID=354439 RepID=A0A834MA85_RHYFE|nr:hypothetical protein GWI33_014919 [Rhynchophorus ferrugineus]